MDFKTLDAKIRASQARRNQHESNVALIDQQEKEARSAAMNARHQAIGAFVGAFKSWQAQGYTFGPDLRPLEFKWPDPSHGTARLHLRWAENGRRAGSMVEFVEVEVSEALPFRPRSPYEERYSRLNEEPSGVLVTATIQVYVKTEPGSGLAPDREIFRPTASYACFFNQDELGQIEEALVPMLEALVDVINAPAPAIDSLNAPL